MLWLKRTHCSSVYYGSQYFATFATTYETDFLKYTLQFSGGTAHSLVAPIKVPYFQHARLEIIVHIMIGL